MTTKEELTKKYIKQLKQIIRLQKEGKIDKEDAANDADWILRDLLDELGYTEVTKVWHEVPRW